MQLLCILKAKIRSLNQFVAPLFYNTFIITLPEYEIKGSNSGVKQLAFNSSRHGEISNFKLPDMLFSFFNTEHGRFKS